MAVSDWIRTYKDGKFLKYAGNFADLDGEDMSAMSEAQMKDLSSPAIGIAIYNAWQQVLQSAPAAAAVVSPPHPRRAPSPAPPTTFSPPPRDTSIRHLDSDEEDEEADSSDDSDASSDDSDAEEGIDVHAEMAIAEEARVAERQTQRDKLRLPVDDAAASRRRGERTPSGNSSNTRAFSQLGRKTAAASPSPSVLVANTRSSERVASGHAGVNEIDLAVTNLEAVLASSSLPEQIRKVELHMVHAADRGEQERAEAIQVHLAALRQLKADHAGDKGLISGAQWSIKVNEHYNAAMEL